MENKQTLDAVLIFRTTKQLKEAVERASKNNKSVGQYLNELIAKILREKK